jgi:uncharacterized RDD family membrane protein YckC
LIAGSLVGTELASPFRRAVAGLVDLVAWLLLAFPALMALGLLVLSMNIGGWEAMSVLFSAEESAQASSEDVAEAKLAMVRYLERRRPAALSPPLRAALQDGDQAALRELAADTDMSVTIQLSSGPEESRWDEENEQIVLANDVIFGAWNRFLGLVAVFLASFTLVPRLLRGWTPGKWLLGVRVVRTDGKPLRLWDCFSRAGGYLGSLGMAGFGFVEACRDANAQAAHDKIADTLVVRAPRFRRAGGSVDAP